jgi:hypothetical protein
MERRVRERCGLFGCRLKLLQAQRQLGYFLGFAVIIG